jgi:hypothetical protein
MDPSVSTRTELDAVRVRRAELRETLSALEYTLASPASGRAVIWGEAVHASLVLLADDFSAHVEVTEGPGGLHQAILAGDLRLANAVGALTAEHEQMAEEVASLVADSAAPVTPNDVPDLRERATTLLGNLLRHRQRGADLIYEAYQTDIGGGD